MSARTLPALAALLLFAASPAAAQRLPESSETIAAYREYLRKDGMRDRAREAGARELGETAEAVAAQPTSVTPPDGFGDRVAGTLVDFLPYFQFGVDSVTPSDDGKAVVVAFNPIQAPHAWKLKLTATIAEPEPFERLVNEVAEASRAAFKEVIAGELGDFDDVTWSASLGFQPSDPGSGKLPRWGRDPELYRPLAEALALYFSDQVQAPAVAQMPNRLAYADYQQKLLEAFDRQPDALSFGEIRTAIDSGLLVDFDFDDFVTALQAKENVLLVLDGLFASFELNRLAPLIHNQPQLVFSSSYRDRAELAGQKTFTATARLEWGSRNVNTVVRRFRALQPKATMTADPRSTFQAYREVVGAAGDPDPKTGWRGTASLTYQRLDELPLDVPFDDGSVSLTVPEVDEWSGKLQLSRFADWHEMTIDGKKVTPRLDLSVEVIEVDGDPKRQDRRVAKITYDLPVARGVTLPVTLVYANKSEFLGDPDEQFSAHVGLSYKLPDWGK